MKLLSSKRRWLAAGIVIFLLLFLLHPGASRLKSRIIASMSYSLGRSVDIGSVHVRILPRPAFDLENLVVYDDPASGAEPLLRASDVTAALRLTSLLRGRIEISRLDLTEPSLNLVRGENGHWNLETLLERTAHTPLAPTSKTKSEPRPAFPYIEAGSARINFKVGPEKKPYALANADFSLWQDSENAWGVRLKAQPVRTDLNLNDTGILQVSGTWQRAAALRDTPLQFAVEWDRGQVGQITKFISGLDQGWRGGVQLHFTLQGTPAKLLISSDTSIDDFRRYDITSGQPMRLAAHCDAQYSSVERVFRDVLCSAPVNPGLITVKGSAGLPGAHRYDLAISAQQVPASALAALIGRAKKNLPDDLTASGIVHGAATVKRTGVSAIMVLEGRGEITNLRLASAAEKTEIGPETIPFVLTSSVSKKMTRKATLGALPEVTYPSDPRLEFGPFSLSGSHVTARGWITRSSYNFGLAGEADISKALQTVRLFGLPALQAPVEGASQLDLQIAGSLPRLGYGAPPGFSGPQITGSAKLHNVRIAVRGAASPVEIVSADLQLDPDRARLEKLNARAANAIWTGSLEMPRGCGSPAACIIQFALNTNQLSFSELASWINPRPKERPWYRVLESTGTQLPILPSLKATGRLTADHFQLHTLSASRVTANVSLDKGKLAISDLTADIAAGKYRGDWQADFTQKPATTASNGTFTRISLAGLVLGTKDQWITGTATASYQLTATGLSSAEFWDSTDARLHFDLTDAQFAHLSLENEGPLKISRMSGQAHLRAGIFEVGEVNLNSANGMYQVTGTASLQRDLELKLVRHTGGLAVGYAITGTLAHPHVEPLSRTEQARLKQ